MERTKRFLQAFNALTEAYLEGTLLAASCAHCAVGNMICKATGIDNSLPERTGKRNGFGTFGLEWSSVDHLVGDMRKETNEEDWLDGVWKLRRGQENSSPALRAVEGITGYKPWEIELIEGCFENNSVHNVINYNMLTDQQVLESQHKALCAVIDLLLELDGQKDDEEEFKDKLRHSKTPTLCEG